MATTILSSLWYRRANQAPLHRRKIGSGKSWVTSHSSVQLHCHYSGDMFGIYRPVLPPTHQTMDVARARKGKTLRFLRTDSCIQAFLRTWWISNFSSSLFGYYLSPQLHRRAICSHYANICLLCPSFSSHDCSTMPLYANMPRLLNPAKAGAKTTRTRTTKTSPVHLGGRQPRICAVSTWICYVDHLKGGRIRS